MRWALRTYGYLSRIALENLWVPYKIDREDLRISVKYIPSRTVTQLTGTGAYLARAHGSWGYHTPSGDLEISYALSKKKHKSRK